MISSSLQLAVTAMLTMTSTVSAQPNDAQLGHGRLLPRVVCADAGDTPCDTDCCASTQRCASLAMVGWACWETDTAYMSTYTDPDLNTMLITAHDGSATLTTTTTEPDLSTMPISAHGSSSITGAPTSSRTGTAAGATTTTNNGERVGLNSFGLVMMAAMLGLYLL